MANDWYSDHVKELNNQRPKQPFFFLKPASSILNPGAGPVVRPKGIDLHYEVELALIIGKELKDLEASDEKGAIEGIESGRPLFSLSHILVTGYLFTDVHHKATQWASTW